MTETTEGTAVKPAVSETTSTATTETTTAIAVTQQAAVPECSTTAIPEPKVSAQDDPSTVKETLAVNTSQAPTDSSKSTTANVTDPVSKKRKLSDASVPTTTNTNIKSLEPPVTQQHSFDLEDYSIIPQTVRDLLNLLQLYGALTAGQLEYNLPVNNSPSLIQDILEVLVCIGLVQKVQEEEDTKTPRYCVSRGVPRADPVSVHVLQHEIFAAHRQANRCFERTKILQKAMEDDVSNVKDTLQSILQEYPEVQQDPVYITALRSCHVDASISTDRPRKKKPMTKLRKSSIKIESKEIKTPPTADVKESNNTANMSAPEEIEVESNILTQKPMTALSSGEQVVKD